MGFWTEFKQFAVKGNVVDLAVGIIIGGAFSTIVKSLVDDVIMPPVGWITGGVDFSSLYINLLDVEPGARRFPSLEAAREAGAPVIAYGLFINNVISFLIVGLAVFLLVKGMNALQRDAEDEGKPTKVTPPKDVMLLTEIRDLLKAQADGRPDGK